MGEAYPPDSQDGDGARLYGTAPEEDLIRLERSHPEFESDAPSMRVIPVHVPPAEPEITAGDPA